MQSIPASRIRAASSGKMPTTSVRRPTSRLKRSSVTDGLLSSILERERHRQPA
jgi:hypothetical protein